MDLANIDATAEIPALRPEIMNIEETTNPRHTGQQHKEILTSALKSSSCPAQQLGIASLQIVEPSLVKVRGQLKELIGRQNKIYVDILGEKFQFDNAEIIKMNEMINNVKLYRDKLVKIKKEMHNIYERTKGLKKRATNIQTCKQKELQRKQQKQQQEESLIGGGKGT